MRRRSETPLENARRRVRQGAMRVKRQQSLILDLARDGKNIESEVAALRTMRENLATMRADAARQEAADRQRMAVDLARMGQLDLFGINPAELTMAGSEVRARSGA
jgi:hypothetical protein